MYSSQGVQVIVKIKSRKSRNLKKISEKSRNLKKNLRNLGNFSCFLLETRRAGNERGPVFEKRGI